MLHILKNLIILRDENIIKFLSIPIQERKLKMMQEVLDILTKNLTNERLDGIIQQNSEYLEITDRVHKALHELEKIDSSKEAQKIIDEYDMVVHEESALLIKLVYQQGMKDLVQLLLSLI